MDAFGSGGIESIMRQVDSGSPEHGVVADALLTYTENELISLFTWENGNFLFREAGPDDVEAENDVTAARNYPVRININNILMESARRVDEWKSIRDRVPPLQSVLVPPRSPARTTKFRFRIPDRDDCCD